MAGSTVVVSFLDADPQVYVFPDVILAVVGAIIADNAFDAYARLTEGVGVMTALEPEWGLWRARRKPTTPSSHCSTRISAASTTGTR